MAYAFNPFTGNFDYYKTVFPASGIILTDSNGVQWILTVDTDGALVTTQVTSGSSGPWLSLGFSLLGS